MNLYNYHSKPESLHFYQVLGKNMDEDGNIMHKNAKGQRHRDGDQPAYVRKNGYKVWYKNGEIHRDEDEPAVIYANGDREWYKNDLPHRDGGKPAVIDADGTMEWWEYGVRIK